MVLGGVQFYTCALGTSENVFWVNFDAISMVSKAIWGEFGMILLKVFEVFGASSGTPCGTLEKLEINLGR